MIRELLARTGRALGRGESSAPRAGQTAPPPHATAPAPVEPAAPPLVPPAEPRISLGLAPDLGTRAERERQQRVSRAAVSEELIRRATHANGTHLGLEGQVLTRIVEGRPILLPVKRWGGALGWRSAKRRAAWNRLMSEHGVTPPAEASGILLRCEVSGDEWVPHPDAPATWAMTSFETFARYITPDPASYDLAHAWLAENAGELNRRLERRFAGLEVRVAGNYHRYGGASYVDLAVLLPAHGEDLLRIHTIWQGETALAELVRAHFPDAVREHAPQWLQGQRFDVYVPSHRLAFEYQGLQHYQPVEYFGGKEAVRRTQERDRRKAAACAAAGVQLVAWSYREPVSADTLRTKLRKVGIRLPT